MDYSTPGSSLHGISQARILEWLSLQGIFLTHELSFSSPGESSWPSDQTRISCIARWTLTTEPSDNPHFGPCLVFKIYNLRQCPKWDISTSSYELICKIYVSMDICIIPRGTSVPVWDCNSIHISFVALITLLQFLAWLSILPSFSRMMQFYPLSILASSFQTKIPPLLLCYLLLYLYCLHQIFGAG